MRVVLILFALLLTAPLAEARSPKKEFERSLKESAQRGVMFGHHDDTMYGYTICFLITWRNATGDDNECYGIYKGNPAEADFKRFAENPLIIFTK